MPKKRSKRQRPRADRNASKAVAEYLESLELHKPKRGRKRTEQSIRKELEGVEEKLAEATPGRKPSWAEKKVRLTVELEALQSKPDHPDKERAFIKEAARYSKQKAISYAAWRELGVPPEVLKKAGVSRRS